MWCPLCGAEYQPGYDQCTDCRVALSTEPPSSPAIGPTEGDARELWHFPEHDPETTFAAVLSSADMVRGWRSLSLDEARRECTVAAGKFLRRYGVQATVLDRPGGGSIVQLRARFQDAGGPDPLPSIFDTVLRFRDLLTEDLGPPSDITVV